MFGSNIESIGKIRLCKEQWRFEKKLDSEQAVSTLSVSKNSNLMINLLVTSEVFIQIFV